MNSGGLRLELIIFKQLNRANAVCNNLFYIFRTQYNHIITYKTNSNKPTKFVDPQKLGS